MVWFEVYTPNAASTIDFYTKLFGWTTEDYDMGNGMVYKMFKAGDKMFAGALETSSPELKDVPPHWSVYINCEDVDKSIDGAKSMGATVIHGPMDIPDVGRMALIQDPNGATFWLFKSAN